MEDDPDRLGPELEAADQRDAVDHQRNDDDRADEVADRARNAETQLERGCENDRLDREEDEGEGGVDQRGDGRADIAEPGAACQQIDIDAAFGGVIGDRQSAAEDDEADDEDGGGGVHRAVVQRDGAADRFQRQERDRAERGIGDAPGGPAARALGREAQRVVFQRLVGNPLIILAPDAVYPLPPCHFSLLLDPTVPLAKRVAKPVPKNLRRYFAVQYTRSCVSVRCTNLGNPRLVIKRVLEPVGCSCQTKPIRACGRRFAANC